MHSVPTMGRQRIGRLRALELQLPDSRTDVHPGHGPRAEGALTALVEERHDDDRVHLLTC
jgi:hypothetical protein